MKELNGVYNGANALPVTSSEVRWERFGKLRNDDVDQPDPQRHIFTSCIFRAGSSALAVISEDGMIDSSKSGEAGVYVEDMRVVSNLSFTINGEQPVVTASKKDELQSLFSFSFQISVPNVEVGIDYTLGDDILLARLRLKSMGGTPVPLITDFTFAADHYDTFYVRFPPKPERGILHPAIPDAHGQLVRYDSIDGRVMQSFIRFSERPYHTPDGKLRFSKILSPTQEWQIVIRAGQDCRVPYPHSLEETSHALRMQRQLVFANSAKIETANPRLTQWLLQSGNDLSALTANLDTGFYPYAGLPWFAVPFGRDGLITGFETLGINPSIMRGVLLHQAKHQAREEDVFHQAWPGKIMHEMRLGETSVAGLNPFNGYYGSIDTTLLFVMGVEAYWRRTGDDSIMKLLWPNVDAALHWMNKYGDLDGDGFIEYAIGSGLGLTNQGWKDSWDAIVHENGDFPEGPIALCEVQGYAYAAWRAGQAMAGHLGLHERAAFCGKAADRLYERFNKVFWQDDLAIYALALDGEKKPCRVRASNMGHLPWCGIVSPDRAQRLVDELMGDRLFSGWGIRTLAEGEKRYRADLYHRGPCWPHEMAIASWSAGRIGDFNAIRKIAETMLDTAEAFKFRMPELLCGYPRSKGVPPVAYKSANPVQAWAAAGAFAAVQSALGLRVEAAKSELSINLEGLPRNWTPLTLSGLVVGGGIISFRVEPRDSKDLCIRILEQRGNAIKLRDGRTGRILY